MVRGGARDGWYWSLSRRHAAGGPPATGLIFRCRHSDWAVLGGTGCLSSTQSRSWRSSLIEIIRSRNDGRAVGTSNQKKAGSARSSLVAVLTARNAGSKTDAQVSASVQRRPSAASVLLVHLCAALLHQKFDLRGRSGGTTEMIIGSWRRRTAACPPRSEVARRKLKLRTPQLLQTVNERDGASAHYQKEGSLM